MPEWRRGHSGTASPNHLDDLLGIGEKQRNKKNGLEEVTTSLQGMIPMCRDSTLVIVPCREVVLISEVNLHIKRLAF